MHEEENRYVIAKREFQHALGKYVAEASATGMTDEAMVDEIEEELAEYFDT